MKNLSIKTTFSILLSVLYISVLANNSGLKKASSDPITSVEIFILSDYNGYPLSCSQSSDAEVIIDVVGGLSPYSFEWSNGATSQELSGLGQGNYSVTVTDALLQTATADITISGPIPLNTVIIQQAFDSLKAIAGGGVLPYTYLWSNGETAQSISVTTADTYSVTVTDANGCTATSNYNWFGPGPNWEFIITNENHTIFIPDSADVLVNGEPIEQGDYIGVFYDSLGTLKNGGYIIWTGATTVVSAFGNDPTTPEIDGFNNGENFIWKMWDASRQELLEADVVYNTILFPNEGSYETNGISGIQSIHGYSDQELNLASGWSIISTFINPFEPDVEIVFFDLQQDIIIMKNEMGLLYYPPWDLNLIGSLEIGEGYELKMNNSGGLKSSFVLYVNGVKVDPDAGIELNEGWNIFGYLHRDVYPIETMLASIDTAIEIVKDKNGNVYIPNPPSGPPINTIQDMYPGDGYKIKILAGNNVILYYPDSIPGGSKAVPYNEELLVPKHFVQHINTGNNHTIIIPVEAWNNVIEKGDEVAVYADNMLVGSTVYNDDVMVIPVFGNDETTDTKDGADYNDILDFVLWHDGIESSFNIDNWIEGDNKFSKDKLSFAGDISLLTNDNIEITIFPNPNKGNFTLSFSMPIEEPYKIELSDATGRLLFEDQNSINQEFSFSKYAPGVYYARVFIDNNVILKKIVIQ